MALDLTTTTTAAAAAAAATVTRSGDSDTETPPRAQQPTGFLAYANGPLKRHYPTAPKREPQTGVVSYKECLRNHAASIGGHALDGCCEFMPSPTATPADPSSLKCAACGCHRNFHRRDPDDPSPIQLHPIRQHAPAQPRQPSDSSPQHPIPGANSSSPFYSSAPHMLLALSQTQNPNQSGPSSAPPHHPDHDHHHHHQFAVTSMSNNPHGKKRFRTKFSQEQKDKMLEFSDRLGWKMQKSDESLIEEFCNQVGVGRGVLKVWMHNNKHTFGKRDHHNTNGNGIDSLNNDDSHTHSGGNGFYSNGHEMNAQTRSEGNFDNVHVSTNGSSSSS